MSSGVFHRRDVLKGHPVSECPSFLGLSNIPLCGWTTRCLSIIVSGHLGFHLLTVVNAGVRCWITFENRNLHERPGLYLGVSDGVSPVVVGQPLTAEITAGVCVCAHACACCSRVLLTGLMTWASCSFWALLEAFCLAVWRNPGEGTTPALPSWHCWNLYLGWSDSLIHSGERRLGIGLRSGAAEL